jgi:hypothetical protein
VSEDFPGSARRIRAGDVLYLTRAASPQFIRPLTVRVVRELTDRHIYHGWTWVEGYELGRGGLAVAKRESFVLRVGLRWLSEAPVRRPARGARQADVSR